MAQSGRSLNVGCSWPGVFLPGASGRTRRFFTQLLFHNPHSFSLMEAINSIAFFECVCHSCSNKCSPTLWLLDFFGSCSFLGLGYFGCCVFKVLGFMGIRVFHQGCWAWGI